MTRLTVAQLNEIYEATHKSVRRDNRDGLAGLMLTSAEQVKIYRDLACKAGEGWALMDRAFERARLAIPVGRYLG